MTRSSHRGSAPSASGCRAQRRSARCCPGCRRKGTQPPGRLPAPRAGPPGLERRPDQLLTGRVDLPHRGTHASRLAAVKSTEQGLGVVHQVDHERLRLSWVTERPIRSSSARRVPADVAVSVRGVCPAIGCEGEPQPFVPPAARRGPRPLPVGLPLACNAVPLSAMEHTAQWTNTRGGADPAAVHPGRGQCAVVLDDLRAGRGRRRAAGRDAAQHATEHGQLPAACRTGGPPGGRGRPRGHLCAARSHDLTRFAEPEVMITGAVRAPYVPLDNERIDRRHAHSVALVGLLPLALRDAPAASTGRPGSSSSPPTATRRRCRCCRGTSTRSRQPCVTRSAGSCLPRWPRSSDIVGRRLGDEAGRAASRQVRHGAGATTSSMLDELRDEAAGDQKFSLAQRYQQVGRPCASATCSASWPTATSCPSTASLSTPSSCAPTSATARRPERTST